MTTLDRTQPTPTRASATGIGNADYAEISGTTPHSEPPMPSGHGIGGHHAGTLGHMDTLPQTLTVRWRAGEVPQVVEPVPRLVFVGLPVLLQATWREWVAIEGSDVVICGHAFRIVSWHDGQAALVLQHLGRIV